MINPISQSFPDGWSRGGGELHDVGMYVCMYILWGTVMYTCTYSNTQPVAAEKSIFIKLPEPGKYRGRYK